MMFWCLLLVTLLGVSGARAAGDGEGWEDFTDNLATDLAPLITLFGERLTKQFLSESTSLLDNLIFALSPLGILTAVVSVIRVCGSSSLRAFVGRAQEAPGEAEHELLSCVSETTAELFNDGGISRVFGRPRILEIVVWEDIKERCHKIGTLREALQEKAWYEDSGQWILDEKGGLPELDIPNLSLNKGIKPRGRSWFYLAALLGTVLQAGTVVYAALTVFHYPDRFKKDGNLVQGYAFPLYLYGSISLGIGMFLCAFVIERSTSEYYFYPARPSKIYWMQPGRQKIGEQDFGAFLGVNEGLESQLTESLTYIKSVRGVPPRGKGLLLIFTVSLTMIGFVLQFIGLRGLHASVVLANLGSTLVMAIARTCLRTKRIGADANRFSKEERELTSYNQQELDCFAFHLENVQSFRLIFNPAHESTRSRSGSQSSANTSQSSSSTLQYVGRGTRLVQTRARLAELTSNVGQHASMDWDDFPIRMIAEKLASTIEMTMDVVSKWKNISGDSWGFDIPFVFQYSNKKSATRDAYQIQLKRSEDTLQWKVNIHELEAVLGLWTLSLLKSDPRWKQKGLGRMVGLTKNEASKEGTDLYFHKWIFRQKEARMLSSKMITSSEQLFGYYSEEYPDEKQILVVETDNKLEVMAAQDIYIQFLMSILTGLENLGGDVDVLPRSQNGYFAQSSRIDELVCCFESGNLGSREDALLCIVPVLKHRDLLPELAADMSSIRMRIESLISVGDWRGAFRILKWLCERCEGEEFERSMYEFGFVAQRAMLHQDHNIRQLGCDIVLSLLQSDIRATFFGSLRSPRIENWMESQDQRQWWDSFCNQLGWIAWNISNNFGEPQSMKTSLETLSFSGAFGLTGSALSCTRTNTALCTLLKWLVPDIEMGTLREPLDYESEEYMEACLQWIIQNAQNAFCHWLSAKWAEIGQKYPQLVVKAFVFTARNQSKPAIQCLHQHGADVNALANGHTALIELAALGNKEACEILLANGADANLCTGTTRLSPLMYAAGEGNEDISQLLVDSGADLEIRNEVGFTAFHIACRENRTNTARLLLDKGAQIETMADDGKTPLIYAVADGNREILSLLLERGANVNAQDNTGCTALIRAATGVSRDIIDVLLEGGANVRHTDQLGRTAFDRAIEGGNTEVATILAGALNA